MHTFYKVLQKNTLRKKICVFLCALCTASLVVLSNANAAGYTCDSKTYVSCNSTFYLSDCGTVDNFKTTGGNSASCNSCPDNHKCDGGTKCPVRTTLSVTCSDGQYIKKGATACSSCPAGHFCKGKTHEIAANGAASDTGATACAQGSYSAAGAYECAACQNGKTTSGAGKSSCDANCGNAAQATSWATATWSENSVSNGCKISACDKGYELKSSSCSACAKGSFKSTASADACTACSTLTGASPTGGTYTTDATGSTTNTACKYTAPAKSITGCTSVTVATVTYNGTTWPATTYTVTANKGYVITNSGTKDATCTACDKGTYQPDNSSTAENCTACGKGTYQDKTGQSSCTACGKGTYQDKTGQSSCTACGKGTYQDKTGQSSCTNCTAIENAEWSDANATGWTEDKCPFTCTGNHTADTDNRQCKACDTAKKCPTGYGDNTYDTCSGETPEAKCKANCQPGTYVAAEYEECKPVPSDAKAYAAAHTVAYGAKSPTLSDCPGGATGNNQGASNETHCYKDCPAEKTIENGKTIFASGHVYYSSDSKGYTDNDCKYNVNCNERYGANSTIATTDPSCTLCDKGSYSPGGQNTCKYCTNAPDTHATYTTNGTTNNNCEWQCNAGYYKSNTSCPSCPNGSTAVPVTSTPGANNSVRGCYISSIKANNDPVRVTDSTGTFEYRLDKDGNFNPCYHK